MDPTTFIAQALGLIYLVVGLGMVVNKDYYKKMIRSFVEDGGFIKYFGGVASLFVGYCIVTFHNEWVQSWEVLITVIGWLALLKGFMLIVQPDSYGNLVKWMLDNMHVPMTITLVLGAIFSYFGYLA